MSFSFKFSKFNFSRFNFSRLLAIMIKEFAQMRRDQVTIGMLMMIPLIQLVLFGFAINTNPRNLPTVIVSADQSMYTQEFIQGVKNTKYFHVLNTIPEPTSETKADLLLTQGRALFIIHIPPNFTRDLLKNKTPELLVTADATDPSATGNAISALQQLANTVFTLPLSRGMGNLNPAPLPFKLIIHPKYNPSSITTYNIIPGLMGVILTMTLVMITGLAITREREFGTMESLLSTPVRPLEVMIGKILPYIIVGYVQQAIILLAAQFIFGVPNAGNIGLLILCTLPFIFANLMVGLTFSTIAKNQLQAMQMTFFFFLPSILLSGFMFPFYGMPKWAQFIGEALPLTHFLRIVRGIMLKGSGFMEIWPNIWPLFLFILVVGLIALKRYRRTLD